MPGDLRPVQICQILVQIPRQQGRRLAAQCLAQVAQHARGGDQNQLVEGLGGGGFFDDSGHFLRESGLFEGVPVDAGGHGMARAAMARILGPPRLVAAQIAGVAVGFGMFGRGHHGKWLQRPGLRENAPAGAVADQNPSGFMCLCHALIVGMIR